MAEALICRRCGAPLPPGFPGATVTCAHCGTSSRLSGGPGQTTVARPVGGGSPALMVLIGAIAAIGVTCGTALTFLSSNPSPPPPLVLPSYAPTPEAPTPEAPAPTPPPAPPPAPVGLPWTALETAETGRWVLVEPPAMSTPPSDFAPDAHIEWAETIARAWSPDSVVVRMDVAGIRQDGGLDLVNDEHATIRYVTVSPIRLAAAAEMAKVSHDETPTSVVISIEKGQVFAMIDDGWGSQIRDGATPPVRSPCTMAQLLAAGGADLPQRPDHEVRLDWREPYSGYPAWLFDVDSTYEVFPDDCSRWTLKAARARD